jgi:hypothetical protein
MSGVFNVNVPLGDWDLDLLANGASLNYHRVATRIGRLCQQRPTGSFHFAAA